MLRNELRSKEGNRTKNAETNATYVIFMSISALGDLKSYAISLPLVLTSFNINESSSVFLLLCSLLQWQNDEKENKV